MPHHNKKNITLKEFMENLHWYHYHLTNWYDMEHEDFLLGWFERWAALTPNHARLWELYLNKAKEPVRFWAAMAWAYGWKNVTFEDIEEILKDPNLKGGRRYEAFDKGVEAYQDTLYFGADIDATEAVDRDIENYQDQLLAEEYENTYVDTDGATLKTYWRA